MRRGRALVLAGMIGVSGCGNAAVSTPSDPTGGAADLRMAAQGGDAGGGGEANPSRPPGGGGADLSMTGTRSDGGSSTDASGPAPIADAGVSVADASAPAVDASAPMVDASAPGMDAAPPQPGPADMAQAPQPGPADMAQAPQPADMAHAPQPVDMAQAPQPVDMAQAPPPKPQPDGGLPMGGGGGGGGYVPPGTMDEPMTHAAPTTIAVTALPGPSNIYDVGIDRGGGIWAVTPAEVDYWPAGLGGPRYSFNQGNGLARGNANNHFASVAGGVGGEAIVGNVGAIADHIVVDPGSGKLLRVDNMVVPPSMDWEYPEHLKRVVSGVRVAVDYSGTFNGSGYIGGQHGFTVWHGVDGNCGCTQFQEHQHFIPPNGNQCDSTNPPAGCWGGDVKGLAFSPQGDVWAGDEHFVALLPQRSLGAYTDFFQSFTVGVDVFPGVNDEVQSLATDAAGGVWVASFGQGLAYLHPMTLTPAYYDRARELPMNRVTAVAVDTDESVWVGTFYGGIARLKNGAWTYYTQASGLPSDSITQIIIDRAANPRRVVIGTGGGVAVYTGK